MKTILLLMLGILTVVRGTDDEISDDNKEICIAAFGRHANFKSCLTNIDTCVGMLQPDPDMERELRRRIFICDENARLDYDVEPGAESPDGSSSMEYSEESQEDDFQNDLDTADPDPAKCLFPTLSKLIRTNLQTRNRYALAEKIINRLETCSYEDIRLCVLSECTRNI